MLAVWDASNGIEPGIYGRMIFSDYSLSPAPIQLSEVGVGGNTMCIARDPAVAYNLYADTFLVAWSGSMWPTASCPADRRIMVREVDRLGAVLGSFPTVVSNEGDPVDPAKAGTSPHLVPHPLNEEVLTLWSGDRLVLGDFDIYAQYLLLDTATSVPDDQPNNLPRSLQLGASPNPFNPATILKFGLPSDGRVRLTIYDVRGALIRVVADEQLPAGFYERNWNGTDRNGITVASGVYYLRLEHGDETRRMRVVLLK
jgi:hypothetical protein